MSRERKRLDRGSKSKQKDFINISNTRTYVYILMKKTKESKMLKIRGKQENY